MRRARFVKHGAAVFLLVWAISSFVHAQAMFEVETQKVEMLLDEIARLKNAKFVRNGSVYDVATAVYFLRRKWEANAHKINTAREFVENVASFSGTSNKPYLIRFGDGTEVKSRDYLAAELRKIESSFSNSQKNGGSARQRYRSKQKPGKIEPPHQ